MAGNTVQLTFAGDSKSLEKAFDKVGKGAKDMAADMDQAGGKVKRFGSSVDTMNDKVGNSESKFMGTADLLDGLGGAFGIPLEGATNMARSFADLAGGLSSVVGPAIGKVAGMLGFQTAATSAQTAATGGATAAQTGLNAAMTANPIGAVIIAIVALIAVGVLLWKNWDTVKDVLSGVWDWMKTAFGAVKDFIGNRVSDIAGFFTGLPGRITGAVGDAFGKVKDAATGAKDWVGDRVGDIVSFFTGLPGRMANAARGAFDWYLDMFKAAYNAVASLWNAIDFRLPEIDLPGPLGKVGGQTIGLPDLPKFHGGGVVPGSPGSQVPIMAMAGETVVPRGGAGTVIVNVYGSVMTENQLVEVVRNGLLRKQHTQSLGFT